MRDDMARPARILMVEDEPLIALDVESVLLDAGYEIGGVAGTLDKALAIVEGGLCDAAILDANLNGVNSAPIAEALTARGLPFMVVSGYSAEQQAEALRAGPILQKPASQDRLLSTLERILAAKQLR